MEVISAVSGAEISFICFRLKNPTYDTREIRHELTSFNMFYRINHSTIVVLSKLSFDWKRDWN